MTQKAQASEREQTKSNQSAAEHPAQSSVYYKNCAAAIAAGAAPLHRGEPGYRPGLDSDGDGVACEPKKKH